MSKHQLPAIAEPVKRSFGLVDLRAVAEDESGTYIEGHPAVYDQVTNIGGWFKEVIERGAFDECDFDDVVLTVNHDLRDIPLARSRRKNIDSTMQLRTDNTGLYIRANLDVENNHKAKALHSSVERKDINGMSFIFYVAEEVWEDLDTELPTRRIKKIKKVIEVSAVSWAAYDGTDINARDKNVLDNAQRALENARQNQRGNSVQQELEFEKMKLQILLEG